MVATAYNVSREKQDQYALISHNRGEKVYAPLLGSTSLLIKISSFLGFKLGDFRRRDPSHRIAWCHHIRR